MDFDRELLAILACPRCRQALREVPKRAELACDTCRLLYPIVDGIADLLPESARSMHATD